jgi:membrane dipeptidase
MDPTAAARRIHDRLPVIDGHNDLPWALRTRAGGDLAAADPGGHLPGYHTDIPRLLAGGVGAQFWSVYVPAKDPAPLRSVLEQIDLVKRMAARHPDHLAMARTAADVERIRASGRVACLMGAEGGHAIEGSLAALGALAELGVGYMTLTHNDTLPWADSATDEARHGGLTDFGEAVVREMNRVGMLVDISHVSADTMRHALAVTRAPVIASHSSARALSDHPRNIPDDVLEAVGANRGVVMVNFYSAFIVPSSAARSVELLPVFRRLAEEHRDDPAALAAADAAVMAEVAWDLGDVGTVVDHIEHVARVAGVGSVGLGSDFDGVELLPVGLEDASRYPAITEELLRRGWDEDDVHGVLGGNALRVIAEAEAVAD